jgi:hypothetical protein
MPKSERPLSLAPVPIGADLGKAGTLVLVHIPMIQSRISLLGLPGEGQDPFPRWAPAFAGVTEFLRSIGPT